MKIDWKRKLASRKFWAALLGFVTSVCALFGVDSMTGEQIAAVISAVGILSAYILGESCVDAAKAKDSRGESSGTDSGDV